jgi:hypothetical protein
MSSKLSIRHQFAARHPPIAFKPSHLEDDGNNHSSGLMAFSSRREKLSDSSLKGCSPNLHVWRGDLRLNKLRSPVYFLLTCLHCHHLHACHHQARRASSPDFTPSFPWNLFGSTGISPLICMATNLTAFRTEMGRALRGSDPRYEASGSRTLLVELRST